MRSFRREILSIGAVFALPLLVLAFFPREAFFFRATPAPRQPEAFLAFTTVSPDEEARLIASLQTTWKPALSSDEGLHLSLRDLPEDPQEPLLKPLDVARPASDAAAFAYAPPPWKPSLKATAPTRLTRTDGAQEMPPFPRDDLLELH